MKILIIILLFIILGWNAFAQERPCTKAEAIEAESAVLKLNNWECIYKSFQKYRHCDDGAIAEGYSESVVRMLAYQWDQLDILVKLVSSDREFYNFVIRHIDATVDKTEIEKIIINSSGHCSKSASGICTAIEKAARKTLKELAPVQSTTD